MRPWLQNGLKISKDGVPLLCDECPCDTTCVCTTAEHLTNPDTLPRQTSYEGMYSAYDSDNFVQSGRGYKYEWDWDHYNDASNVQEAEWTDLGSTGDMWGYYASGYYSAPSPQFQIQSGNTYGMPACVYLMRQYKTYNIRKGLGDNRYHPYITPTVRPNIASNDCNTVWDNRIVAPDPYLMVPITVEIKLHGWTNPTGDSYFYLIFAANCITPTGTRQTWDIQTTPMGNVHLHVYPLKSLKINGIECVRPEWRKVYTADVPWRPYYEVPAGTIMPGRIFAPPVYSGGYEGSLYTGFNWFRMKCLGDYDPDVYIHKRSSGVVSMIPADGDLDYLVPMIDALENNYIEP